MTHTHDMWHDLSRFPALKGLSRVRLLSRPGAKRHSTTTSAGSADTVTITFRGINVSVPRGTQLRTALLVSEHPEVTPHNGDARLINCRGLGTCGTCAVEIRGTVEPQEWTTAETLRLNFPPHSAPNNGKLRLACQVRCMSDLEVTKYDKFWGQGDLPLGPLGACTSPAPGAVWSAEKTVADSPAQAVKPSSVSQYAPDPKSRLGVSKLPFGRSLETILDRRKET